jgi:hypothetical protein
MRNKALSAHFSYAKFHQGAIRSNTKKAAGTFRFTKWRKGIEGEKAFWAGGRKEISPTLCDLRPRPASLKGFASATDKSPATNMQKKARAAGKGSHSLNNFSF